MTTDKHNKRPNVPPLRFPEFSGEWEKHLTTDFLEFKNGLNPDVKRFGSGTKFISVMDILNNRYITYDKIISSVEAKGSDLRDFGVNYGDILFQRSSETLEDVGRANVYLDEKPALFGGFVIRGKKIGDYNPLFFRYLLSSPSVRKRIIVKGAGAQHFNIGQDGLSKVSLFVPSAKEQDRIARLLNAIDKRIEVQSGLIEKLESLISGICKQFHDKTENWIQVSFVELGEDYSGLTNKSAGDFGKGKPYITYLNVNTNHIIDESQIQYVSVADDEKQNKVHWGDVIFTLSSETPDEVAVGSVYLGNCDELYLNSFCFGIHIVNEQYIYQPYLSYFISSPQFRKWVFPLAQGSTRFNLQKADFMKKKFLLPPIKEQKKLYDCLSSISKRVVIESSILSKLQLLKLYLLQQMFI